MPLVHHELCFGCGRSNLFGLLLEVEPAGEGSVAGRWFVKQDHQGPTPGQAHPGILACVLVEAIALAAGEEIEPTRLQFELERRATLRVGSFCEVHASIGRAHDTARGHAVASHEGLPVARLTCAFASAAEG